MAKANKTTQLDQNLFKALGQKAKSDEKSNEEPMAEVQPRLQQVVTIAPVKAEAPVVEEDVVRLVQFNTRMPAKLRKDLNVYIAAEEMFLHEYITALIYDDLKSKGKISGDYKIK